MIAWFNHNFPNVVDLGWGGQMGWGTAIQQTIFMTFWSAVFGGLLGLIFGIVLVVTDKGGLTPNRSIYWLLDKVVSILRAIPFIILLFVVAVFGITSFFAGTTLGPTAALVSLSLGVFPFYARQVQAALNEVDKGLVEAAQSVGATFFDILFAVYLRESLTTLIRVTTVTLISLVGLTAMAGAIGAGGLGNVAVAYGYGRFENDVTFVATLLIMILVLLIQLIGDFLATRLSHR
jgi:D-methionine transport system permease protein